MFEQAGGAFAAGGEGVHVGPALAGAWTRQRADSKSAKLATDGQVVQDANEDGKDEGGGGVGEGAGEGEASRAVAAVQAGSRWHRGRAAPHRAAIPPCHFR